MPKSKMSFILLWGAVLQGGWTQELQSKPQPTPFKDWDYLVYSQRWPISACLEWQQKSSSHTCNLPDNNTWTVHGIWPTKIGKDGPFFCNSALHFDDGQIAPLRDDLNLHWTNVEGGTKENSFWKHEWDKHGTCASVLPQLNSVTNFFKRGLQLHADYSIYDMLKTNNIVPEEQGYTVETIYDTIKAAVKKNPSIECIGTHKESLISEIRICFDKNFDVIDCNVTSSNLEDTLINCDLKKPVMYLNKINVPSDESLIESSEEDMQNNLENYEDYSYHFNVNYNHFVQESLENFRSRAKLSKMYRILKFLMWFTL